MTRDDELSDEERRALAEAWPEAEPPAGFAERVMGAARAPAAAGTGLDPETIVASSRAPQPRRRGALAALVVAAAVAGAGVVWLTHGHGGAVPVKLAGGVQSVGARQQIDIGGRAVAVAEPGASLSWHVAADGGARLQQTAGDVFYRVEPGKAFVVDTPAGEVRVLGTCFRVEVTEMKPGAQKLVSAGAGAMLSAAVLVTVYEGKVRVQNEHGRADVVAGESARAEAGRAPMAVRGEAAGPQVASAGPIDADLLAAPPATITREELIAREAKQREKLAALDARVRQLEAAQADGRKLVEAGGNPRDLDTKRMWNIPPDEWADMATRCEVRFALPPLGTEPHLISADEFGKLGLSADEGGRVNDLLRNENDRFLGAVRALYIEATGDTSGAETLDLQSMEREIEAKARPEDSANARRRIALEHAGKQAPPADLEALPVIERYYRLVVDFGDQFQSKLVPILGQDRADKLREDKLTGWRASMNGCSEGEK
jgi:ferric-dicitrate binding protein FerR (iron transport regulator)